MTLRTFSRGNALFPSPGYCSARALRALGHSEPRTPRTPGTPGTPGPPGSGPKGPKELQLPQQLQKELPLQQYSAVEGQRFWNMRESEREELSRKLSEWLLGNECRTSSSSRQKNPNPKKQITSFSFIHSAILLPQHVGAWSHAACVGKPQEWCLCPLAAALPQPELQLGPCSSGSSSSPNQLRQLAMWTPL